MIFYTSGPPSVLNMYATPVQYISPISSKGDCRLFDIHPLYGLQDTINIEFALILIYFI